MQDFFKIFGKATLYYLGMALAQSIWALIMKFVWVLIWGSTGFGLLTLVLWLAVSVTVSHLLINRIFSRAWKAHWTTILVSLLLTLALAWWPLSFSWYLLGLIP